MENTQTNSNQNNTNRSGKPNIIRYFLASIILIPIVFLIMWIYLAVDHLRYYGQLGLIEEFNKTILTNLSIYIWTPIILGFILAWIIIPIGDWILRSSNPKTIFWKLPLSGFIISLILFLPLFFAGDVISFQAMELGLSLGVITAIVLWLISFILYKLNSRRGNR